jgi:hypothetical protein
MESLLFILKRFFYSFLAGCIINFYIIIYYYILKYIFNEDIILFLFLDIVKSFININPYFVFIITSILISIIIEGIVQVGVEW